LTADFIGDDEYVGAEIILGKDREGVRQEIQVGIVEGQHDGPALDRLAAAQKPRQGLRRHRVKTLSPKKLHLLAEGLRRRAEALECRGSLLCDPVIHENGNRGGDLRRPCRPTLSASRAPDDVLCDIRVQRSSMPLDPQDRICHRAFPKPVDGVKFGFDRLFQGQLRLCG
jgi:hypothetical protein